MTYNWSGIFLSQICFVTLDPFYFICKTEKKSPGFLHKALFFIYINYFYYILFILLTYEVISALSVSILTDLTNLIPFIPTYLQPFQLSKEASVLCQKFYPNKMIEEILKQRLIRIIISTPTTVTNQYRSCIFFGLLTLFN